MHINKGKTIAQCLTDRTEYSKNPAKTNDGELVRAYECDPEIADAQFLFSKREYKANTGREQENNIIAYQIRQSFKPGEVSPEEANRIGYDLATRWTKGRYAFIVATHVDKAHIHNHIIYNSTSLDCSRKFRNFWNSSYAIRRISDRLCLESGLTIIEEPKKSKSKKPGMNTKRANKPLSVPPDRSVLPDCALLEKRTAKMKYELSFPA
jgi:type IV secretory pathway VirD2 relaxase